MLFIGTFFICLFIFMMQFLWRYVDELVGKGLDMTILAQFFFYSALSLVPVSMPLAVLLASLITFGNFGERFELLAMKAAGISLLKIMRPLIVLVCMLSGVSFYFQNVIAPIAQANLGTLLISMKQKSPEVDIPEGVFYSEIPGYNLKVARKDRETGMLYDVLIYHTGAGFENARVIYADSGRLEMTADKQHLFLHLYSGELFENLKSQNMRSSNVPYRRESFGEKHSLIEFDSEFNMADASIMSNQSTAKNMKMLQQSIDSMRVLGDSVGRKYYKEASAATYRKYELLNAEDTVRLETAQLGDYDVDSLYEVATLAKKQKMLASATMRTENLASDYNFKSFSVESNDYSMRRHKIEWHKKLTFSISCLLFFFIGASLGGIIRKGGLGMPAVISVLVFIIYYIIDNSSYKMARDGEWIVWMGMWTSSAVLAPLGLFLTYKSNKDASVMNIGVLVMGVKKLLGMRGVRHLFTKEVIINDPNYEVVIEKLAKLTVECEAYRTQQQLKRAPNYINLWMENKEDGEIKNIAERLEWVVEELSNTKSSTVLAAVTQYPIIAATAHLSPFKQKWMNVTTGVLLPVGLFFYLRIWAFRLRMDKDMERIIQNNKDIKYMIQNNINA